MPMTAIEAYWERLPARMAELKLVMSEAVSVPYMERGDRENKLEAWERAANLYTPEKVQVAPRGLLRIMGVGVRRVSDSGKKTESK